MNKYQALYEFYNTFGIPAYEENSVPEDAELPYITYPLTEPEWSEQSSFYCQVWYPKKKLADLLAKADEICTAIGTMKEFEQEGGYIVLYPSTPLIQILSDEMTQSAYINLSINAYHMPGA